MTAALVADALVDNRAGRLTAAQRSGLRNMSRGWRKSELQFAAIFAVIGLLVWFAEGPARYAAVKPLVGIGFLVLAGALVVVSVLGGDPVTRDLREGRVLSVDGAIAKYTQHSSSRGSSVTSHYAEVAGVVVETGPQAYAALPDAGIVRLFYLPHSRRLVNFEQLADRPLPEGALEHPGVALKDAVKGVFGDADARAELAAIGHAMEAQVSTPGVAPPPAAGRDARPLAQAIVGNWKSPRVTATFAADGGVDATLGFGMKRSGRWSVDPAGRLVSDITGTEGAVDAWIADDRLTLELDGRAITLERVRE